MRFLIDNNLSPKVAAGLAEAGHDVQHVRDLEKHAAPDEDVMAHARTEDRVLISADTDFGALLASSGDNAPSVLLVRRISNRRAAEIVGIILANLDAIAEDLIQGAIVVFGEQSLRIRRLPVKPQ